MIFTREPIIETILSPRDGCKLCIRNSKVAGAEELFVDAVEVVSFGHAFFFRSQERPKPFLVPVSDYEIFEVKETRVVLKNITHERNIKISGGREAFAKPPKEMPVVQPVEAEEKEEGDDKEPMVEIVTDGKSDKKRDRRRNRRKRIAEERRETVEKSADEEGVVEEGEKASVTEVKVSSAMFANLLPPPPVLISETLGRLREKEAQRAPAAVVETSSEETAPETAQEIVEEMPEESKEAPSFD